MSTAFPPNGRRLRAEVADIIAAWRAATTLVPAEYAVATAEHESDRTLNEVDTEPSGFVSIGIFQISRDEAVEAGHPEADLMTLEGSCRVLAALAEKRLAAILRAACADVGKPVEDVWFYLALAHNEGLGAAEKTIRAHGLDCKDWTARNAGNPKLAQAARYFADCITGGPSWPVGAA